MIDLKDVTWIDLCRFAEYAEDTNDVELEMAVNTERMYRRTVMGDAVDAMKKERGK